MAECIVYGSMLAEESWSITNFIALGSIVADLLIAAWITFFVNRKLSSERELKNYFIKEIQNEKELHRIFWCDFESSSMNFQDVLAWFKLRNMESSALMTALGVGKKRRLTIGLDEYVRNMRNFIDDTDWMKCPQKNGHHKLSSQDRSNIARFKKDNSSFFHLLISEING